ncbi:hypothetical protein BH20ACI2_BH20ACI2_21420 [soil metagenome]
MEIIIEDGMMLGSKVESLLKEGRELTRILAASKIKARQTK